LELQELEMGPRAEAPENRPTIEALRKAIPEPILAHYDRLTARGKKGVALVRHGVCSGCQMKLATGVHAALLRDDDIAMCDNCARYLLVAPELPPVEQMPPPKKPTVRRGRRKASAEPAA
jgi:predicted  nucleic acid-binding Zn-ribbon protein